MSKNYRSLSGFGAFEELDDRSAETISGGAERFAVLNQTSYQIPYAVDGVGLILDPGTGYILTAGNGGNIQFDSDARTNIIDPKKYNLANGDVYAFRDNKTTTDNPYDIDLYQVA